MHKFIKESWPELSFKEKAGYYLWRLTNFWKKPRTYVDEPSTWKDPKEKSEVVESGKNR